MAPKTWCPSTKEQGIAGREAPRPACRRPIRLQRRGARRRKNKGLRGVRHHVRLAGGAFGFKDVVLVDERARFCGEGGTTSGSHRASPVRKTWCPSTKEQGFAGSEAPRRARRRRLWLQRRGARRRKNKGLRGGRHHVRPAGDLSGSKDVVPVDERARFCGEGGTTSGSPAGSRKGTRTWCKGNGGTGFCEESCTKTAPAGPRLTKPPRRPPQKITKSVKTPGASGSIPLLSGLAASQYLLGFNWFKSAGSSYFSELSISSWMS